MDKSNYSWWNDALDQLKFEENAGWPDIFGKRMRTWLGNNNGKSIKTLSLFSGAGGLDIGFHDAGFHTDYMVELEAKYVATLKENSKAGHYMHNARPLCMDIRDFDPEDGYEVDFIIGGPPCQTFSAAGRRASGVLGTSDPRGMLFHEYVRLLKKLKPKAFLFENVYGITGAEGGQAWKDIQAAFKEAGYCLSFRVLDTADYGTPQHRERLIIVGIREGEGSFKFPYPTHGPDSRDRRDFYSAGVAVDGLVVDEPLRNVNGKYGHLLNGIPAGLNYSFYTERMGHPAPVFGWRSKFSDFLYKADPKKPVRVIKAQGGQYTGPFSWQNRPFTVSELKRLQSFPDDYELTGGRVVAIEQIGLSVPPQMARVLALSILDQIFGVELPFKIEYMPDNMQLSFRTYKRELTKGYERKAKEAIDLLKHELEDVRSTKFDEREVLTRYLSTNFHWSSKSEKIDSKAVFFKNHREGDTWVITGGEEMKLVGEAKYVITVRPSRGRTWRLGFDEVQLRGLSMSDVVFTGLWKLFEEKLTELIGIADLVQFSGYYQYEPQISATIEFKSKVTDTLWIALRHVLAGTAAKQLPAEQFAALFSLSEKELFSAFKKMRMMGFEIRNTNTNPQIPDGHYLVPYFFPTLNPRSVQLRKDL